MRDTIVNRFGDLIAEHVVVDEDVHAYRMFKEMEKHIRPLTPAEKEKVARQKLLLRAAGLIRRPDGNSIELYVELCNLKNIGALNDVLCLGGSDKVGDKTMGTLWDLAQYRLQRAKTSDEFSDLLSCIEELESVGALSMMQLPLEDNQDPFGE